jgi:hypothetical protein
VEHYLELEKVSKVLPALLAHRVRIEKEISISPGGSAQVCAFWGSDGKRYLAKAHHSRSKTTKEKKALLAINSLSNVRVPHFYGEAGGILLLEYIPGETLRQLNEREDEEIAIPFFRAAVISRAALQAHSIISPRRSPFRKQKLIKLQERLNLLLEGKALGVYQELCGRETSVYYEVASQIDFPAMVNALYLPAGARSIAHNDFQLGNIIAQEEGGVAIIDWEGLAYAPPWPDITKLLNSLSFHHQMQLLKLFHDTLIELSVSTPSFEEALGLYYQGLIYRGVTGILLELGFVLSLSSRIHCDRADNSLLALRNHIAMKEIYLAGSSS